MKLTKLEGVANELIGYLDNQIWFGFFKDIPSKVNINILEKKDGLSKMCVAFFKERLPKSFDFNRIKKINLNISKSSTILKIGIKIKVDEKEFVSKGGSIMNS